MYVTISARHCTPTDSIRHYAEERLRRLLRFEPRLLGVEVSLEVEHGVHRAEARVSVPGETAVVAEGRGDSFRVALDRMTERVRRQLKNRRSRRRDHQAAKLSERLSPAGGT